MADRRDAWAERYNRRTRAIERQALAAERIATALEVQALAAVTSAKGSAVSGPRVWKTDFASKLMNRLSSAVDRLPL